MKSGIQKMRTMLARDKKLGNLRGHSTDVKKQEPRDMPNAPTFWGARS
jgi:hypothetical protein